MDVEEVARAAVDCGYHVHKELGPGLLETVYELVLMAALRERGYLRLTRLPLGLLMNFGMASFRDGVRRLANNYYRDNA